MLVVEDDEQMWPLWHRIATQVDPDLAIDFVASRHDAIGCLRQRRHYDAVLVDYCLPSPGDGTRLREPIGSLQPRARVAMMSSLDRLQASDCAFLPKPFTPAQAGAFLRDLLI